jgi:putative FmdB family regulatory protein
MPTYRYRCGECGDEFEVWQSIKDDGLATHDDGCGGPLVKVLTAAGIVLKGSGFYKNDSRSDRHGADREKEAARDGASSNGEAKSGDDKSSDGKSSDGKSSDGKSSDGKPGDTKAGNGKSGDGKSGGSKSGGSKSGDQPKTGAARS